MLAACSEHAVDTPQKPWPLETAIARELTGRFASPATARCEVFGIVPACSAEVLGTRLPIRVASDGRVWTWDIDGHFIDTRAIAPYVDSMLGDLHVKQSAQCGPALQKLGPGERLACALSGGGSAFVDVDDTGAVRVELAIDRETAKLRAEGMTPERAKELEQKSRALEHTSDDDEP
jgi:hypothetical protein